ncbi:hypothetical protein FQN57_001216 [Myotisia sp. PD_48]|nr:hypothetical protein FQN57_001216 [Myotisia sp. PD_48]
MAEPSARERRRSLGVFGPTGLLALASTSTATSSHKRAAGQARTVSCDVPSGSHANANISRTYRRDSPVEARTAGGVSVKQPKDKYDRRGSRGSLFSTDFIKYMTARSGEERKLPRQDSSVNIGSDHGNDGSGIMNPKKTSRKSSRLVKSNHSPHVNLQHEYYSSRRSHSSEASPIDLQLSHSPTDPTARARSKSVQRSLRNSVFGSLRSFATLEEDQQSMGTHSRTSSSNEDDLPVIRGSKHAANIGPKKRQQPQPQLPQQQHTFGTKVLHHGEVQTSAAMWRRKHHYMVLTESHLVRFKSQAKASEVFSSIPASWGRNSGGLASNRLSMVSLASLQDNQLGPSSVAGGNNTTNSEGGVGIALNSIIATHRLDDGKPFFSIEVCYADEKNPKGGSIHIQLNDPQEASLWMIGIRAGAENARSAEALFFDLDTVEYIARSLEKERDYDPDCFDIFRVVHRSSFKPGGRSSIDDISKLTSNACILAIGVYKLHLLPLIPRPSHRSSVSSLPQLDLDPHLGFMSLSSMSMQPSDDAFQLIFRTPFENPCLLNLSSVSSSDILLLLRQRTEFLRPEWIHQPFSFNVPNVVQMQVMPPVTIEEDHGCFDRTLIAYCAAYNVDTSKIRYTVDYNCEDAPCFQLLPREGSTDGRGYLALELLAVMRALRYNESFATISFARISLDVLHDTFDPYGPDYDTLRTRSNAAIKIPGQEGVSCLVQEVRALALKSKQLRRMDFSRCLTRRPSKTSRAERDRGCGIPEAIFPLCRRKLTGVNWLVLNGIALGESDLDYLIDAASQRVSGLRGLEVADCGISMHDLNLILSTLRVQEQTFQCLSVSNTVGRFSPDQFQQQFAVFSNIRKLDLSCVLRASKGEPLISAETLLGWELQELCLSQTTVNARTVDAIATYLASSKSNLLRELRLDQCGLTGGEVATLLYFMVDDSNKARNLHLHVSENRLNVDPESLFESIAQGRTPTHLTMKDMEFERDDDFRLLVEAITRNTSIKYLDMAKLSLPHDASTQTSEALQRMFECNNTIEELDISSEQAHLDISRFGMGLNLALTGLKRNTSLKVLKIEHQKLGVQGANTLASVIEENDSLVEIHCENNDINLQAFTILVNALQKNHTILYLPCMTRDCDLSLTRVKREMEADTNQSNHSPHQHHYTGISASFRRSLYSAFKTSSSSSNSSSHKKLVKSHPPNSKLSVAANRRLSGVPLATATSTALTGVQPAPSASQQLPYSRPEVKFALAALRNKWESQVMRLQRYLYRNYTLLHGPPDNELFFDGSGAIESRPATAASLGTFLNQLALSPIEDGSLNQEEECLGGSSTEPPNFDDTIALCTEPEAIQAGSNDAFSSTPASNSITPLKPEDKVKNQFPFPNHINTNHTNTSTPSLATPVAAYPRPIFARNTTTSSLRSSTISSDTASLSLSTTGTSLSADRVPPRRKLARSPPPSSLRSVLISARASRFAASKQEWPKEKPKKPPMVTSGSSNNITPFLGVKRPHELIRSSSSPPQLDWTLPDLGRL